MPEKAFRSTFQIKNAVDDYERETLPQQAKTAAFGCLLRQPPLELSAVTDDEIIAFS